VGELHRVGGGQTGLRRGGRGDAFRGGLLETAAQKAEKKGRGKIFYGGKQILLCVLARIR
jgi:hypothetical protein